MSRQTAARTAITIDHITRYTFASAHPAMRMRRAAMANAKAALKRITGGFSELAGRGKARG
jgi:hypothetical protein